MLVSVITVVEHEVAHLRQLIRGVDAQSRPVDELVIVAMGRVGVQAEAELASSPVTILHDPPACYRPGAVATARAEGAAVAVGELLVFLDADLVPGRDLVARYEAAAATATNLLVGPIVDRAGEKPRPATEPGAAGNAAAARSVWERLLAGEEDPRALLVDDAVAHRQRRRCTGRAAWWDPVRVGHRMARTEETALHTLPS